MSSSYLRQIYIRLAGAIVLIVACGLAANAYFSQLTFERALAPEMVKKVSVSANSTRELILEAIDKNIPVREIYGIEQTFDELKASMADIAYVALTDANGDPLFQRFTAPPGALQHFRQTAILDQLNTPNAPAASVRLGDQYVVTVPIVSPQGPVGSLHVGVSVEFVNRIILDMLMDVVVVLVVSLFFTLELLHFLAGRRIETALNLLGDVLNRGANGDFSRSELQTRGQLFGNIVARLDSVRARVDDAYQQLARTLEASLAGPAHERPPRLASVHQGMGAMAQTFRFGAAKTSSELDDDVQLSKIRAPLFLFILAEELTRPFLPGYVNSLLVKVSWISPEVLVGLPIVIFMLIVALGQPLMGYYTTRFGTRRMMQVGACVAAVGFVASAMAHSVMDLLVWRSLCAVGYGFVFVAAQSHVLAYSRPSNRARSFTVFIGAIMVATVCGPSIGGILADNIGERQTFALSALLALASLIVIHRLPVLVRAADEESTARLPKVAEIASLLVNLRFMTLTGLAAIPAKMLLTGMCFYLVPIYLVEIGSTQSVAGRVLMTYGVVMVVMMPLSAHLATTRRRMEYLVAGGLALSGLGGLALLLGETTAWVYVAVLLVGLGQSLSMAPQTALVREHCSEEVAAMGESSVYGVYRLLERLGNAAGPIVAAGLVLTVGHQKSFVVAGAALLTCAAAFILLTSMPALRRTPSTDPSSTEHLDLSKSIGKAS